MNLEYEINADEAHVIRVIESCKTLEQWASAVSYVDLWLSANHFTEEEAFHVRESLSEKKLQLSGIRW